MPNHSEEARPDRREGAPVTTPPPLLPAGLLARFEPAADALLDLLRPRIDDSMLREIAEADYGFNMAENLREMRRIRDTGRVPAPMQWEPHEVLALTRWSEPKGSGSTLTRQHLMRAFACAALLRAGAEPANFQQTMGENDTLAQLLASAMVLGQEVLAATARFVAWRQPLLGVDEARPFFALALLVCAVSLGDRFGDEDLAHLADWVVAEERWERGHPDSPSFGEASAWLLGLTVFDQRHSVWHSFAGKLREAAAGLRSPAAQEKVRAVAESLLGGQAPLEEGGWRVEGGG